MALLVKSCLLHRTVRCASKISAINSNLASFQHIHKHIESQSLIHAQRFCTTFKLSKDANTPDGQVLIYEGGLTKKMRVVKIFSLTTSGGGLCVQPFLIQAAADNNDMLGILGVSFIFLLFTVANPIFIHTLTKRYVTHLFYDEKKDEYTAWSLSFFLRRKEIKFKPEDIKPLELTGMFTSCEVKGTPLFIDRATFENPELYDKMMGIDYNKVFPINLDGNNAQPLNEDLQSSEKSSNVEKQKYN